MFNQQEYYKEWYKKNKKTHNAYCKKWYEMNKTKKKKQSTIWNNENPKLVRYYQLTFQKKKLLTRLREINKELRENYI